MADNIDDDLNRLNRSAELANEELQRMAGALRNDLSARPSRKKTKWEITKDVTGAVLDGAGVLKDATGEAVGGIRDFMRAADATGDAFEATGELVEGVIDAIGVLAKSAGVSVDALRKVHDVAENMLDVLTEQKNTWQELSKIGIATADGLAGTEKMFLQSKLSLNQFTTAMTGASQSLALMYGTASQGGEDFTKVLADLAQGDDMSMRNLGMNADEMVSATTSYMKVLSLTNRDQQKSVGSITAGAKEYAASLDLLSRLTGISRDELAKKRSNEIENNTRLLALMATRSPEEGKNIQDTFDYINETLGSRMAEGYLELNSGVINDAGRDFIRRTGISRVDHWKSLQDADEQIRAGLKFTEATRVGSALANEELVAGKDLAKTQRFMHKSSDGVQTALDDHADSLNQRDELTKKVIVSEKNLEESRNKWNEVMIGFLPVFSELTLDTSNAFATLADQVKVLPDSLKVGDFTMKPPAETYEAGKEQVNGIANSITKFFTGSPALSSNKSLEGLNIKSKEAIGGGGVEQGVARLAQTIQTTNAVPGGLEKFSAFNDSYHQAHNSKSKHTQGLAVDFTLKDQSKSDEAADYVRAMLAKSGINESDFRVIDEYKHPSPHATGGHIHVQFNNPEAAQKFAELSGEKKETTAQQKVDTTDKATVAVTEPKAAKEEQPKTTAQTPTATPEPEKATTQTPTPKKQEATVVVKTDQPNTREEQPKTQEQPATPPAPTEPTKTPTQTIPTRIASARSPTPPGGWKPPTTDTSEVNTSGWDRTDYESPTTPSSVPTSPVSQIASAPATDLTVPKSNYQTQSTPSLATTQTSSQQDTTVKKTMSFDQTIALMRDMSSRLEVLEKTTNQELSALNKATRKAKV